jgi:hypothetical protein
VQCRKGSYDLVDWLSRKVGGSSTEYSDTLSLLLSPLLGLTVRLWIYLLLMKAKCECSSFLCAHWIFFSFLHSDSCQTSWSLPISDPRIHCLENDSPRLYLKESLGDTHFTIGNGWEMHYEWIRDCREGRKKTEWELAVTPPLPLCGPSKVW